MNCLLVMKIKWCLDINTGAVERSEAARARRLTGATVALKMYSIHAHKGSHSCLGGVTYALGTNDRGVTGAWESFVPLTPLNAHAENTKGDLYIGREIYKSEWRFINRKGGLIEREIYK